MKAASWAGTTVPSSDYWKAVSKVDLTAEQSASRWAARKACRMVASTGAQWAVLMAAKMAD
jgi:hypothetical protein